MSPRSHVADSDDEVASAVTHMLFDVLAASNPMAAGGQCRCCVIHLPLHFFTFSMARTTGVDYITAVTVFMTSC